VIAAAAQRVSVSRAKASRAGIALSVRQRRSRHQASVKPRRIA
jgi:hypothetical protein